MSDPAFSNGWAWYIQGVGGQNWFLDKYSSEIWFEGDSKILRYGIFCLQNLKKNYWGLFTSGPIEGAQ